MYLFSNVLNLQSNLKEKFLWCSFVDVHGMKRYGTKTAILLNLFCEVVLRKKQNNQIKSSEGRRVKSWKNVLLTHIRGNLT